MECRFGIQKAATIFKPELVVYNAGTDVLEGDPLGRLLVSFSNLNLCQQCGCIKLRCTDVPRVFHNSRLEVIDEIKVRWLQVSPEGVKQRDEMVFQFAKDQNAPVIMLTSGPARS